MKVFESDMRRDSEVVLDGWKKEENVNEGGRR